MECPNNWVIWFLCRSNQPTKHQADEVKVDSQIIHVLFPLPTFPKESLRAVRIVYKDAHIGHYLMPLFYQSDFGFTETHTKFVVSKNVIEQIESKLVQNPFVK